MGDCSDGFWHAESSKDYVIVSPTSQLSEWKNASFARNLHIILLRYDASGTRQASRFASRPVG